MAETLVEKSKFQIIFQVKDKEICIDYKLNDTELAHKWFQKIIKIHRVPIDPIESKLEKNLEIEDAYKNFCKTFKFQIDPNINFNNQKDLNLLHALYEKTHDALSKAKQNQILYEFHYAVHQRQKKLYNFNVQRLYVGWGTKEGPLQEKYNCSDLVEKQIKNLHIYLPWTELGKKPYHYWESDEPHDRERFNELCVPHVTLRCQFFIATANFNPPPFPKEFIDWFYDYKQIWCEKHSLSNWDHTHEFSAPLLAIPLQQYDCDNFAFKKIVI